MQHLMSCNLPVPPAQTAMIFSRKPKANTEAQADMTEDLPSGDADAEVPSAKLGSMT